MRIQLRPLIRLILSLVIHTRAVLSLNILALSATNGVISATDTVNGPWTFTPVSDFVGTVTLTYVVSDGNVGGLVSTNSFDVLAVNDAPVMTSGTIPVLTLLEDAPLSSMGLTGLSFAVGGGSDESSQSLTYQATVMPDAAGIVYKSDGVTPVSAGDFLSLTELQNLKLLPAASSTGSFQFKFTVFDDGSGVSPSVNSSH